MYNLITHHIYVSHHTPAECFLHDIHSFSTLHTAYPRCAHIHSVLLHVYAHTYTHTHTCIHTYIHACMHTYIHAHTHINYVFVYTYAIKEDIHRVRFSTSNYTPYVRTYD
jgi:hypothetical protein